VWEELVLLFVVVQRGLREMEAWLTMMRLWRARQSLVPLSIVKVQPGRIGVWLNGATKTDVEWLLRTGIVPIYIIHQYVKGLDFPGPSSSTILDRHLPVAW
jgi:hypothetical protein